MLLPSSEKLVVLSLYETYLGGELKGTEGSQQASFPPITKQLTTMENQNFSITFLVDQTPHEVFNAVNNVRGWWSEQLEGNSEKLHDEFSYRHGDIHYSKHKLTEVE